MMGGNRQQWLDRLRGLRRTQPTPAEGLIARSNSALIESE